MTQTAIAAGEGETIRRMLSYYIVFLLGDSLGGMVLPWIAGQVIAAAP
jgi:hypothetical protein